MGRGAVMERASGRRTRVKCGWRNGMWSVPVHEESAVCEFGTEATMSAIRLARGFTKRDKILKFEGCYMVTRCVAG